LPMQAQINSVLWSADGKKLNLLLVQKIGKDGVTAGWVAFDPASGAMTALAGTQPPAAYTPETGQGPLRLKATPLVVKDSGTAETLHLLWLEAIPAGEKSKALVASEAE